MKLLIVEDDAETASFAMRGFREHGHVVDLAADGRDGLYLATENSYDVLIVDRMIPKMDGLSLVKALRSAKILTPVLFLTTMSGIDDRVEGLEGGGDDYLVKPYAFSELNARVNALARRPPMSDQISVLEAADLRMDLLKRSVTRSGDAIDLQPREFQLLEYLLRHSDQVVTRTMLLEGVWDFHFDPRTNIVETHISRLRSKINRGSDPELIHTIRGSGYSLRAPAKTV
jgi:two-component system OmpR family response regulator